MPQLTPRSPGLNQWLRMRATGGNPMPWNQALRAHTTTSAVRVWHRPKVKQATPEQRIPMDIKMRGLVRSAIMPLKSLDTP